MAFSICLRLHRRVLRSVFPSLLPFSPARVILSAGFPPLKTLACESVKLCLVSEAGVTDRRQAV